MEDAKQSEVIPKIVMRHPHTEDTVEVEATSEGLTPWMVKGYQQFNPPVAGKE